jgi:predicted lipid-binding transport protein (Tim44 family)
MGLIKNIFGAIFGVIGGAFKGILGLFGIGKSEYYLEAEDGASASQPQAQPKAAPQVEKPAAPQQKQSAASPAASAQTEAAAAESQPAPAPKPVPVKPKAEPVGNFATDYLNAPSANMGRRRPGPSLSPFKDLAKDMKLPSGAR